jgi:hypothetical protein
MYVLIMILIKFLESPAYKSQLQSRDTLTNESFLLKKKKTSANITIERNRCKVYFFPSHWLSLMIKSIS